MDSGSSYLDLLDENFSHPSENQSATLENQNKFQGLHNPSQRNSADSFEFHTPLSANTFKVKSTVSSIPSMNSSQLQSPIHTPWTQHENHFDNPSQNRSPATHASIPIHSQKKKQRTTNFSVSEDMLLVLAWLNISMDAVHANEQKSKTYWRRIYEYFHQHKDSQIDRSQVSLQNRWSHIQLAVNKFCGCYAQIEGRRQSGISEQDKLVQAKLMFSEMYGSTFAFDYCWTELRFQPKWLDEGIKKKNKNSPSDTLHLGEDNSLDDLPGELNRPIGRKAAKELLKTKKKQGKTEDTSIMEVVGLMRKERKQYYTVKNEFLEKAYLQEQEKITLEKEKMILEKKRVEIEERKAFMQERSEEERILALDLSTMSPIQVEYYSDLRQKSLAKKG